MSLSLNQPFIPLFGLYFCHKSRLHQKIILKYHVRIAPKVETAFKWPGWVETVVKTPKWVDRHLSESHMGESSEYCVGEQSCQNSLYGWSCQNPLYGWSCLMPLGGWIDVRIPCTSRKSCQNSHGIIISRCSYILDCKM